MASPQEIQVLLVNGTVGVGKSSVADAVFEMLAAQSQPVALINIDELGYARPRPKEDPFHARFRLKNLTSIWPNYREAGVKAMIIPCVIESRDEINYFHQAIPNARIFVVRLDAPQSVVETRIRNRPMGGDTEWHIKRAAELAKIFEKERTEDVVVETQDKTITEIAQEVILKWQIT